MQTKKTDFHGVDLLRVLLSLFIPILSPLSPLSLLISFDRFYKNYTFPRIKAFPCAPPAVALRAMADKSPAHRSLLTVDALAKSVGVGGRTLN